VKVHGQTIVKILATAKLTAGLLSPGDNLIGETKPIQNLRAVGNALHGDDLTFFAVPARVSTVVVYCGKDELTRFDNVADSSNAPMGGDLLVPFSQGIVEI
jgi:hypothetical protein